MGNLPICSKWQKNRRPSWIRYSDSLQRQVLWLTWLFKPPDILVFEKNGGRYKKGWGGGWGIRLCALGLLVSMTQENTCLAKAHAQLRISHQQKLLYSNMWNVLCSLPSRTCVVTSPCTSSSSTKSKTVGLNCNWLMLETFLDWIVWSFAIVLWKRL